MPLPRHVAHLLSLQNTSEDLPCLHTLLQKCLPEACLL